MRRNKIVTIATEGRDKGKDFFIEEMFADQAEWWAYRAFLALSRSGVVLPDNVQGAGFAGLATLGLKALGGVEPEDAKWLMTEMFKCIKFRPDRENPDFTRPLVQEDIEEVATRVLLRLEVFELHAGFSLADVPSRFPVASTSAGQ